MEPIFKVRRYEDTAGRSPYSEWLKDLDKVSAGRVVAYVARMQIGNLGNSRWVGQGVAELKIDFGPGYRVYYLRDGEAIVVLLCGGDKGSQAADIRQARIYAEDYWERR